MSATDLAETPAAPEADAPATPPAAPASREMRDIVVNALWKQNPGLVQILGLCPTLAISSSVVNALSLGLATALVMALASSAVAFLRNFIPHAIRIPVFILIIATLVTMVDLLMHAYMLGLYQVLGIFIPLIVVNCIVLARVESFASKRGVAHSFLDGLMMGIGLTFVLVALGGLRDCPGQGHPVRRLRPGPGPGGEGPGSIPLIPRLPRLPAGHPAARRLHRPGAADRRCATGIQTSGRDRRAT
jgi:electron transport complex protein RnfE